MILIKQMAAIEKMAEAGTRLAKIFDQLPQMVVSGLTTGALDAWVASRLAEEGLVSQCKGYKGYQHVSCISINDEVVHGIPTDARVIAAGDIVKVDVCAAWKGYCADMARSFLVHLQSDSRVNFMVQVAHAALDRGIEQAVPGNRLSDISAAIQKEVEKNGFGVVRDFAGHGIGRRMHEDPEILNYGEPGRGPIIKAGMAFAIEPMITMGAYDVEVMEDGWTVKTRDGCFAAHVEDTVVVTADGPKILTRR